MVRTFTEQEAYKRHEECRQNFIRGTCLIRDHLSGLLTLADVKYEVMRVNAAVAQGMIWAEMLLIDPAGWLDRMHEIDRLWSEVK